MAVATQPVHVHRATAAAAALAAPAALLAALAAATGLGRAGWAVGGASAAVLAAGLALGLGRRPGERLGPASWVTLARATLAVGVAALALDDPPRTLVVALASVALCLDLVDGRVARRTGTVTRLGARFDGEVDAFLILALSVVVAPAAGAWVLAIGAWRYVFLAGEWGLPWMRAPLPARRWRKVVAGVQGVVLTVAVAGVLPRPVVQGLLLLALALLTESFGRDTLWLWRRRPVSRSPRPRRLRSPAFTALALAVVWAALVVPDYPPRLTAGAFAALPVELLVVLAAVALLPPAAGRVLVWPAGAVLGAGLLLKVLDLGFFTAFDRPFDAVYDWGYASIGVETLGDAIGRARAWLVVVAVGIAAAAVLVLPALALRRVTRAAAGRRRATLLAVAVLGAVWALLRVAGAPAASTSASAFAVGELRAVARSLRDHDVLARAIARDRFRDTPARRLLTGLRGKDVLLLFVESYGRVAVQGSPGVDAVLDRGTAQLRAAGFGARSGFLASPTFGGISWLAHGTLQSGVWIDSRRRYDQLVRSDRFTLARAFGRAGWRTVGVVPQDKRDWRVGSTFYRFHRVYDRRTLGYRGPAFGLPAMPDQYVLQALRRLELARRHRPPVFSEVDLISSHAPWSRIPRLVPWGAVGDGSVFARVPPADLPARGGARAAYARSIEYTLSAIVSYVRRYGDKRLVLVVLGDHQPATTVTGQGASHDVPVSIVARDPKVLRRIAPWGWSAGLRPAAGASVRRMSTFRDAFLTAFGPR